MLVSIQNFVYPKVAVCREENLYYKKVGLPSSSEIYTDKIAFKNNQRVNFDTYYNALSIAKWKRYTFADANYFLKLRTKGCFTLELVHTYLEDGEAVSVITDEYELDSESECDYMFEYFTENTDGMLSFNLVANKDGSEFYNASYLSDIIYEPRSVKLGIGICTFKREEYVKNNIATIKEHILDNTSSPINGNLEIFISDNAGTLDEKDFDIPHVHLVRNKNTGGSGGFTRCMIEAINYNKTAYAPLTTLVLMDDDIKFDTECLERTYSMLSLIKDEYLDAFIGGAMLRMDNPKIQHTSGEAWRMNRPKNFVESFNHNRDLTDIKQCLENELFVDSNHQAWWFSAIPMKFVREDNLAMPFFIKSDDIEYSERNMTHNILLNGINVWHESFESKYSAQNEYYTVRNYLVSASAHRATITKKDLLDMLHEYTYDYICNYKYLEIEHFCNAINDFLGGVEHLKKIDLEDYHKSILSKGYKMVDIDTLDVDISDDKYHWDTGFTTHKNWFKRKLAKYTINGLLLPSLGYAILGMWGGTREQCYRKKFLVRYECNTRKGFILHRSLKKAIKMLLLYKKTQRNIKHKFDRAKKDYAKHYTELCSLENWQNQL